MPDNGHIALLVAVGAAITWALRALPFAALTPLRHSPVVRYLSVHMPVGVMVILALYTLRDVPDAAGRQQFWSLFAVGATVGLHLWRARPLLSILVGTAVYVVLMSVWP